MIDSRLKKKSREQILHLKKSTPYCQVHSYVQKQRGGFPERTEQIFLVGDSFTFGEGVNENETISYLLGAKSTRFNFRNFGVSQNNISHVYQWVQLLTQRFNAEKFIYFYNLNDVLLTSGISKKLNRVNDLQKTEINCDSATLPISKLWALIKRYYLLSTKTSETIDNYHEMYFGNLNHDGLSETIVYLKAINDLISSRNGKLILVIYPLIYKDKLGRYPFSDIHKKLIEICHKNRISCIDGSAAFSNFHSMKQFRVHKVDYHPNQRANNILVDFLIKQKTLQQLQSF